MFFFEVRHAEEGDSTCLHCTDLCNQQKFLSKVSNFVLSMDMATVLHARMFDPESLPDLLKTLRSSANYLRRQQSMYEWVFALETDKLHLKVRSLWCGRMGHKMKDALATWMATYVSPCLDTEPGHSFAKHHIDSLMQSLCSSGTVSETEMSLVRAIVTGEVSRHPALQGILCACLHRLKNFENGTTTLRNRHRALSTVWNGIQDAFEEAFTSNLFLEYLPDPR